MKNIRNLIYYSREKQSSGNQFLPIIVLLTIGLVLRASCAPATRPIPNIEDLTFDGGLTYEKQEYDYVFGSPTQTHEPSSVPSASDGVVITYHFSHTSEIEWAKSVFNVDPETAVITIYPSLATEVGSVTYTIRARAEGYVEKSTLITLNINSNAVPTGAVDEIDIVTTTDKSFVLRWSAPSEKGKRPNGVDLTDNEIKYRVHYRTASVGETVNSEVTAISVKNSENFVAKEVKGRTIVLISELDPSTVYFVTVESINSFAGAGTETLLSKVAITTTSESGQDFEGQLSYADDEYSYPASLAEATITPSTRPSIPMGDTSSEITYSIETYSIENLDEELLENIITIDQMTGDLTIDLSNPGKAYYVVDAKANGYSTSTTKIIIYITSPTGPVSGITLSSIESDSFRVQWNVPIERGTDQEGRILNQDELVYNVYYLEGAENEVKPHVDSMMLRNANKIEVTGVNHVSIIDLNSDTRYFVTVTTVSTLAFGSLEIRTNDVVEVRTQPGNPFTGSLRYQEEYNLVAEQADTIDPVETPVATGIDIRYTISRVGAVIFDNEPTIDENGQITIPLISNAGTARYQIVASAEGYETQRFTITITIESEIQVNVYYSTTPSIHPVDLGQAIKDTGTFSLEESVLVLNNIVSGEFTIHFGGSVDNYDDTTTINKTADVNGSLDLSRTDLANLPLNADAVIGISGPGILNIHHIATYQPSKIYSTYDLQSMRLDLGGNYVLQNDIVFTAPSNATESNFEAVGNFGSPFTGTLDGNRKSIKGVQIYKTEDTGNYQGLFGVIEASNFSFVVVQNLTLQDFNITGYAYVGSLAGWVKRGTVQNVHITIDSGAKVEIRGFISFTYGTITITYANGGGLIGRAGSDLNHAVIIQNVSSEANVEAESEESERIGGLIGLVNGNVTVVSAIFMTGSVISSSNDVGGLVGLNNGTVSGYVTGNVTGNNEVGGLVGENNGEDVSGHSTAVVSGSDNVGGLVGLNTIGTVLGYVTGNVTGIGNVGGLAGSNNDKVVGYATGEVSGTGDRIGGLVGNNNKSVAGYTKGVVRGGSNSNDVGGLIGRHDSSEIVYGYARGLVRRPIDSTKSSYGKTIGFHAGTIDTRAIVYTYHSQDESKIHNGETDSIYEGTGTGTHGDPVTITSSTTAQTFNGFMFAAEIGKWTWQAGNWPAINIGDDIQAANNQPIAP